MGLKEIVGIRQYTTFNAAGKIQKMYEVKYTTQKTRGEFTFDVPKDEYKPDAVMQMARQHADAIDAAITAPPSPPERP